MKLFGKVLKNQIDEEFWYVQVHVRQTVLSLLSTFIREKFPSKRADEIKKIVGELQSGRQPIDQNTWTKVIERMYEEADVFQLRSRIIAASRIRSTSTASQKLNKENSNPKHQMRSRSNTDTYGYSNKTFYSDFLKAVLDF